MMDQVANTHQQRFRAEGAGTDPAADLAGVLEKECQIVHDLVEALVRQRAAVAEDDARAVDQQTDAIGTILLTLAGARELRMRMMSGPEAHSLDTLEVAYGPDLPVRLVSARSDLRRAVENAAVQVAINRAVLKKAAEFGDGYLQALFSNASQPAASYGPNRGTEEGVPRASVILNRVV
jgi:hypothetical protein